MAMVTNHSVVLLDRDDDGVLRRNGEIHFATPEAVCAAAPAALSAHAGAIALTLEKDPETGDLGEVKVHAVVGEWDMAALVRDGMGCR
jgi:hypothetical protein